MAMCPAVAAVVAQQVAEPEEADPVVGVGAGPSTQVGVPPPKLRTPPDVDVERKEGVYQVVG